MMLITHELHIKFIILNVLLLLFKYYWLFKLEHILQPLFTV